MYKDKRIFLRNTVVKSLFKLLLYRGRVRQEWNHHLKNHWQECRIRRISWIYDEFCSTHSISARRSLKSIYGLGRLSPPSTNVRVKDLQYTSRSSRIDVLSEFRKRSARDTAKSQERDARVSSPRRDVFLDRDKVSSDYSQRAAQIRVVKRYIKNTPWNSRRMFIVFWLQ